MLFFNNLKIINSNLKYIQLTRRISSGRGYQIQNHYEVLGVKESCSSCEIKEAFVKKIKLLHPDKNAQNPTCHNQVITLNEAYSVLNKAHTRALYDHQLARERGHFYRNSIEADDLTFDRTIFRDGSLWENRDRREDQKDRPYYGIKGVNRLSNNYIATGVILFMIVGAILHYYIVKISTSYSLNRLDERSRIANLHYLRARQRLEENGKKKQIELLLRQHKKISDEEFAE